MTKAPPPDGKLTISGADLEYKHLGPSTEVAPTIVLLHEGIGSVGLWRDFPQKLQTTTGLGVFTYSRAGYGRSSAVSLPRPLTYVHDEALDVLPQVLDGIGFRRGLLIGHSDGASIATIYAGGSRDERILGLSLIAPHFVVEDITVRSIAAIKSLYETGDLKPKLARWHSDPDNAFYGWSGAWLDPDFRSWDIREFLPRLRSPLQIVQGANDQYGTMRQIEIAQEAYVGEVDVSLIADAAHAPHQEAPGDTLDAIAGFAKGLARPYLT